MNSIAKLSQKERQELFSETAKMMQTTSAIIEKDFWVVWILDKIFSDEKLSKILMFKGGTSLSKVFNLIGRFSEDIDLILDWNIVTNEDPNEQRSKTKQGKYNKEVNEKAKIYIRDELLPIIAELVSPLCSCRIDEDDAFNINVSYPTTFDDKYLRPEILLEIGPLAAWLPYNSFEITSYAAKYFSEHFKKTKTHVNAIVAARTFWEKATILHQEANRSEEKPLPTRYSRHYYDLAIMTKSDVKIEALADMELLEKVIDFKNKFYPASWAKFDEARPNTLKLVPPEYRLGALEKDYKSMEHMIFDKKLTFEEIVKILKQLEIEINNI
ncbi:nucleotidyl transferase AbiEii/AbiGii toxin family protein [Sulfurimonas hydrogeniphila]|uniref:nucleotidyl transferase AbiEii/AbiGii toxin family protein n=1 Tax=Sulfurimonas hydrogeniphila TaxID=2509341 RepID=UPI0012600458|nr:nucleotidyl transferase AbiEii/AbiGii toxin family protein [Sulfurimonas hydrogeniphila]